MPRKHPHKSSLRTRQRLHQAYHRAILAAEKAGHKATAFLTPRAKKVWSKLQKAYGN